MVRLSVFWMVSIFLAFTSAAVSFVFMDSLPETVVTHWGPDGNPDGRMDRLKGVFLIPAVMVFLLFFFRLFPMIDPLKENYEQFRRYYEGFILVFSAFLFIVQAQLVSWNMGYEVDPNVVLPVGVGFLFIYLGSVMGYLKRNWFIGIRTPWTLSDDVVWGKTHRLGGRLFIVCGLISLSSVFFTAKTVYFIVFPVLFAVVYLFVYSYFEYGRQNG